MANKDNPSGFLPMAVNPTTGSYLVAAGQTINTGDLVSLDSDGKAILATATSPDLLGVAAYAGTAGSTIAVYDDPECDFVGQCSGNFARNLIGTECDIEGTTGIQEVNENAHVFNVVRILGYIPSDEIGANTRVVIRISKHSMGESPVGPLVADLTGDVVGDTTGTHVGQWATDATATPGAYCDSGGIVGATELKAGTNLHTAPEFSVDASGNVTALSLATDTISESTSAAGVTVDGCLIKDGKAAVALTSDACSGNSATATTAGACSGNSATATAMAAGLVRTTAEFRPCTNYRVGADWVLDVTGPGATLAAEKTGATLVVSVDEPEGRNLTGWKASGLFTQTNALSITGQMFKRTIDAGAYVESAVDVAVTMAEAGGAITASQTFAAAVTVAADASYYIVFTATTGVDDTCTISNVAVAAR